MSFKRAWHGAHLEHAEHGAQRLNVTAAVVQGFEANMRHLKKKRVCRVVQRSWQPIVIQGNRRIDIFDA